VWTALRPHTCQTLTTRCIDPEESSCVTRGVHTCCSNLVTSPIQELPSSGETKELLDEADFT
jgi:hypothetical protein